MVPVMSATLTEPFIDRVLVPEVSVIVRMVPVTWLFESSLKLPFRSYTVLRSSLNSSTDDSVFTLAPDVLDHLPLPVALQFSSAGSVGSNSIDLIVPVRPVSPLPLTVSVPVALPT